MPRRRGRRSSYRRGGSGKNWMSDRFIQGAIYGMAKGQINRLSENLFRRVPGLSGIGQYADELGTIGLAWGVKKFSKDPKLSQFANRVQFAATSDLTQKVNLGQVFSGLTNNNGQGGQGGNGGMS